MKPASATIEVTVVLALPDRATEIALRLPAGATLADAIERSGLAARHPEADLSRAPVGIFGRLSERGALLANGDRIEVYRGLVTDPKESRVRRAASPAKSRPK
jgi:putative ubiquitin-RnfH superfamily antitoxin RatB of RatAB toxin-antitoxin module